MRPRPGDAGGEGADHQDAVQQAHLAGAVQEQGQRPQLQRDPQTAADGAAAPRGDSGSARSVSHARHFAHAVLLHINHGRQSLACNYVITLGPLVLYSRCIALLCCVLWHVNQDRMRLKDVIMTSLVHYCHFIFQCMIAHEKKVEI